MDFAAARRNMVNGQIRPNAVTDPRIVAALRELPRERFLPPALAARAYTDADIPLPGGRVLPAPLITARLVQLAALRRGERALALAAGPGYGAALLAAIGGKVTAVEDDPTLLALARAALPAAVEPGAVTLVEAPPQQGHAAGAPYDVILIEGAIPAIPRAIEEQLIEGGRLVTVLAPPRRARHAVLVRRIGSSFSATPAFDAFVAPLASFAPAPSFAF